MVYLSAQMSDTEKIVIFESFRIRIFRFHSATVLTNTIIVNKYGDPLSTNHLVLNDSKICATCWGTIRASRMLVKALKGIRMSKMQFKGMA